MMNEVRTASLRTARDTTIAFSSQVAVLFLSIITSVLIARFLGPEGKGILAVLLLVAGISQAFSQWGVQESILYYFRKYKNGYEKLYGSALMLCGLLSVIVTVIAILVFPIFTSSILKGIHRSQIYVIMLSVPFTVLGLLLGRLLQLNSTLRYNAGQIISAFVSVVIFILSFYFLRKNVFAGIIGHTGTQIAGFVIFLVMVLKSGWFKVRVDFGMMKNLLGSGSLMQIGLMATLLGTQIGILLLNAFSNHSEIGLYSTAIGLSNVLLLLPIAVRLVLQNRMVEVEEESGLVSVTNLAVRHTLLWLTIGSLGLVGFGHLMIRALYGDSFIKAYTMLLFLLPGTIAMGGGQVLASYFVANRYLLFTSVAAVVGVSANLLILLVMRHNLHGINAAASSGFSMLVWSSLYFIRFNKLTHTPPRNILPGRAEIYYFLNIFKNIFSYILTGIFHRNINP